MSNLTFDEAIGFSKVISKHNRDVFRMIVEAQKSGNLCPFVGAGLSFPFGYKLWGGVLAELAEYIPVEEDQAKAFEHIRKNQYEDAAQTILDSYPFMLDQLPGIVSPSILRNCPDEKMRTSAAWTLPYLFRKGLVMTTNFDRVLEYVYLANQKMAIPTVTPKSQDRLAQLRQNQALSLFKLHGDIGSEAVSIDDLVFTGEQYNKNYADDSPLVAELTRWFANRRLLFLGCSLNVDRTMKVLKQVALSQPGIRHFAILGCKQSEISGRLKDLHELGILPIFYDDRNHDAVRVILERLLEETNQVGYRELKKSSWVAPPATKEDRRLLFDGEYFPFSGRVDELRCLHEFCIADNRILWWAVTGPGGMGKSRLVYEFCKNKQNEGWQTERFEAHPSRGSPARSLEELAAWTPDISKTIVVLDDVQAYMEIVCKWLSRIDRTPRSEPLRILLLERDGEDMASASWLDVNPCGNGINDWCYDEKFLHLKPMTDPQLMAIINDYAAAAKKSINAQLLLNTLDKVDPKLKRPLYAIAIADARCQGKDPTNWDRSEILDTLLNRELDFHFNRLLGINDRAFKLSKTLRSELENLMAHASIQGVLPLNQIDLKSYETLQKRIDAVDMKPEEFFDRLGILRTAHFKSIKTDSFGNPIDDSIEETIEQVITLSCPDLIKEHLVLKQAFEKRKLDLLPDGWQNDPGLLLFLHKLWIDYPERLKDQTAFWNRFFDAVPPSGLPAWIYGNLLWGCTSVFKDLSLPAVAQLDNLYRANTEDWRIVLFYAKGLVNLSTDQDTESCASTIAQLKKLYGDHKDCQEIAIVYAKGLVNLSHNQDTESCASTIAQLKKLYEDNNDCQEIATVYASGLVNLSLDQNAESCTSAVTELKKLYDDYRDCQGIVTAYAEVLLNLSDIRVVDDYTKTVGLLKSIYDDHTTYEDVAEIYAASFVGLSFIQEEESQVQETLSHSQKLLDTFPSNAQIQVTHAQIWFNLTLVQDDATIPGTVTDIVAFLKLHPTVIPDFKEALDEYLSDHPEHTQRYQPLLDLHG